MDSQSDTPKPKKHKKSSDTNGNNTKPDSGPNGGAKNLSGDKSAAIDSS